MSFEKYLINKKALIITLDGALYPKKDYLLQVYYLFSEFMAYSEQLDSKAMIEFMSIEYAENGEEEIFNKTATQFGIPESYKHNFNLLHETARLPLKLLLFKQVLELLQEAVMDRVQIFIIAEGNLAEAINKIKQIEWHGLQEYLKVYFMAEYNDIVIDALTAILKDGKVEKDDAVLFIAPEQLNDNFTKFNIDCYSVSNIL